MMNLEIGAKAPHESIREYVYRLICDNILKLRLIPGTALSEQDVASRLHISRTPAREAFIRLAQEGLVVILPQKGTYVAQIDLDQVAEARFLRETMEQAIIKIACGSFPQQALFKLQDCLDLQEICVQREDSTRFFELDGSLHELIFAGVHKSRIWKIIEHMSLNYNRVRRLNLLDGYYELPRLFEQHQQIVEAIAEGDAARGGQIIAKHIGKVAEDIEELKTLHQGYFK